MCCGDLDFLLTNGACVGDLDFLLTNGACVAVILIFFQQMVHVLVIFSSSFYLRGFSESRCWYSQKG